MLWSVGAGFGDDEEELVADFGGEGDAAELEGACPAGDVGWEEGEHYVAELVGLGGGVVVAGARGEDVELFVVVVDYLVGKGCGKCVFLAGEVHAAAYAVVGRGGYGVFRGSGGRCRRNAWSSGSASGIVGSADVGSAGRSIGVGAREAVVDVEESSADDEDG